MSMDNSLREMSTKADLESKQIRAVRRERGVRTAANGGWVSFRGEEKCSGIGGEGCVRL